MAGGVVFGLVGQPLALGQEASSCHVARRDQHQPDGGLPVPPGASHFLVVGLSGPGWSQMDHRPHIGTVNSHPEGVGGHHHIQFTGAKAPVSGFAGFRFEVSGDVMGTGFHSAAVAKADELGCFGWIQDSEAMTVVGEARCAKTLAPQMKEFLYTGGVKSTVDDVHVYDYPDTKIKLHFSHFKRLGSDRVTCFPAPPHACRDDHLRRWPEGQEYPDGCDEDGCEPIVGSGEEL